jgi:predicted GH43/DUF377 family glycosyl hydrolase
MWYSAGEQNEPDAIGYATSQDGIAWKKYSHINPIFLKGSAENWDSHKVTGCQVMQAGAYYVMFYIGFKTENDASIGMARSKDGIIQWERFSGNPIITPGKPHDWDADAVYKPFVIQVNDTWHLYYNGRNKHKEQIGVATYNNKHLWPRTLL